MHSNTMSVTLLLVIIAVELDIRHVYRIMYQTIFTNNATILTISRYISSIVYFH